jgi:3-phenylpropionate/trans-cinnamate dioxygenase ferredoxin reductase component
MSIANPAIVGGGGGLAGASVASRLRELGHEGGIALIGQERRPAYDRPPLSKDVLLGQDDHPALPFDWDALAIDLRLGSEAEGLRRHGPGWDMETTDGPVYGDRVVIATGASPRPLPGAGRPPAGFDAAYPGRCAGAA